MAKSIRSKIKRKHRAEFRRTHGTVAHNKAMEIIQSKLKEAVNKGTMNSFDRIADQLDTDGDMVEEAVVPEEEEEEEVETKGENKAPGSKRRSAKRKHKMSSKIERKEHPMKKRKMEQKSKPKYFCEF